VAAFEIPPLRDLGFEQLDLRDSDEDLSLRPRRNQ
jgi:hypothetical protein